MKVRILKKLLNDTKYAVTNDNDKFLCIGSPMCHDLISVNVETLQMKCALDTWNKGRDSLKEDRQNELLFIYDTLAELIANGEIKEILNGRDQLENPLPVYTYGDGVIIESVTDEYGWPNTDDNGICMYENTHFQTKIEAIKCGIQEFKYGCSNLERRISEREKDLKIAQAELAQYKEYVANFEQMKSQIQ